MININDNNDNSNSNNNNNDNNNNNKIMIIMDEMDEMESGSKMQLTAQIFCCSKNSAKSKNGRKNILG